MSRATLILWAAAMLWGCGDRSLVPEHDEPKFEPNAGTTDCPLTTAADLDEARSFADEFVICAGGVPDVGRSECSKRDGWLRTPEYGPEGIHGPWTVSHPTAVCIVFDAGVTTSTTVTVDLPPVVFPPMQATWGRWPTIIEECQDRLLEVGRTDYESRRDAEDAVDRYLACTGAEPHQRVVDCWGPVPLIAGYPPHSKRMIPCRLQNLAEDYAYVEPLRAK